MQAALVFRPPGGHSRHCRFKLGQHLINKADLGLKQTIVTKDGANTGQQIFRRTKAAGKKRTGQGIEGVDMFAPEVIGHFTPHMIYIGEQFDIKELSALKCLLDQHALTKPMDGKNSRPVDIIEGKLQDIDRRLGIANCRSPVEQGLVNFSCVHCPFSVEQIPGFNQSGPDAGFQFLGSGFGEGDNQNPVDRLTQLHHRPQHQHADGISLTGPRTCLYQIDSLC